MSSASRDIRLCDHCNHTFSKPLRSRASATLAQLRAHHIPTSSERENFSHLLSEAEADLESYDEEINRLAAVLLELRGQRAAVQRYADDFRSFQAPIRRLPVEVLGEIFAQGVPQWPGENPVKNSSRANAIGFKAPLTLGLVCKKWQDIVLSSKGLWSTVIVDLNAYEGLTDVASTAKLLAVKELLDVYLLRSGNAPLSISLLRGFPAQASGREAFNRTFKTIYEALAQQSHRWCRARIMINTKDELAPRFWSAIAGKLPELEELQIQSIDDIPTAFVVAPKLHTVTLFDYFGDDSADDPEDDAVPLPWEQIRNLLFDGQYFDFTAGAEECSQLNRLEINTASLDAIQLIDDLRCDTLEHLSLHAEHWDGDGDDIELGINGLSSFFDLITVPSLKSLTLGLPSTYTEAMHYTQNVWPSSAFTSLIDRSSCSLNTLCLENIKMTSSELVSVLLYTPTVTSLKIHEIPVQEGVPCPVMTDTLLTLITLPVRSDLELLVPRLTRLELKAAPFFEDQYLLKFIESRRPPQLLQSDGSNGVACLESVVISYMTREMEPTCLERLRALGMEGLEITMNPAVLHTSPSFSPWL